MSTEDNGKETIMSTLASRLTTMTIRAIRSEAEEVAKQIHKVHWREGTFPIDPVLIASRMGVEVFSAQLGDDVFGMLVGNDMYIDIDQPPNRYRFTAAHELGHYVERTKDPDADVARIDRRSDENRGEKSEVYANHFAGALLMPISILTEYDRAGMDEFEIAEAFGVSVAALSYRRKLTGS